MDTPVYQLSCKNCNKIVSTRGQLIYLISKNEIQLYSTDLVTKHIKESQQSQKFEYCHCIIRQSICKQCDSIIGYHVIEPCYLCMSQDNNQHYWMFQQVNAQIIEGASWSNLDAIEKFDQEPIIFYENIPDHMICPICYDVIEEASILKCGHTFCKVCITRTIDLKKQCPLDNRINDITEIYENYFARETIQKMLIYCKHGCVKQNDRWIVNLKDDCCKIKIELGNRYQHEKECQFNIC